MGFDLSDIGDALEDGASAVKDGIEAGANAIKDGVETVVNTMAGVIKDGVTYSYGFASNAAQTVVEEVEDHTGMVLGRVSDGVGGWMDGWVKPVVKVIEEAPKVVAEAAVDTLDWGLNTMDTVVFDPVETMTFGLVAPNYEDGNLSVEAGVPDVLYGSAQVGEDGVGARYEDLTFAAGGHLGTNGSFGVDGRAGLDIAGLPGAKGHIEHRANGEISIDGKAQAIIPTPVGILDASAHGGFEKNADGSWSTVHQGDATMYTPDGAYSGNFDVQVSEDNHGNTDVGVGAGVGYKDYDGTGGTVDVAYQHDEDGGTTTDGVNVHGTAHADGADVDTNMGVTHTDSPDGSLTTVQTHTTVDAEGLDIDAGGKYEHEESADGTTRDSVGVNAEVEAGDNKFGGDVEYENTERADGSETETFGAHMHAEGDDFQASGGVDHTYDRDAQGRETETTKAGFDVKAGDVGVGGTYDNTTVTAPDGTETSITHTDGHLDGIDMPGLPDGFDSPPSFDDLLNQVPRPEDAFDQIPTPEDAFDQIPTPDELPGVLIAQVPAPPDLSALPDQIPGDIPGLGDLTDIPEVQQALSELPDMSDVELPDIGPVPDVPFADQLPSQADMVGALASSGDLSGVLGEVQQAVPEEATGAIQAVATFVQDGGFDDFTGDVVAAEVNEAAADEVWDDLDQ